MLYFISVTYFVTYGTAMACYAYFVLTKQEYLFKEASDRQYLINFYKRAQGRKSECCWEPPSSNFLQLIVNTEEIYLHCISKQHFINPQKPETVFDVARFNSLKEGIYSAERDLKRLRDPLRLRLPQTPSPEPGTSGGILPSQLNIGNLKSMLKEKFS